MAEERVFQGRERVRPQPPHNHQGGSGSAGKIYRFTFRGGRPAVILHFVEESDVKYIYGRAATHSTAPAERRFSVCYIIRAAADDFPGRAKGFTRLASDHRTRDPSACFPPSGRLCVFVCMCIQGSSPSTLSVGF